MTDDRVVRNAPPRLEAIQEALVNGKQVSLNGVRIIEMIATAVVSAVGALWVSNAVMNERLSTITKSVERNVTRLERITEAIGEQQTLAFRIARAEEQLARHGSLDAHPWAHGQLESLKDLRARVRKLEIR